MLDVYTDDDESEGASNRRGGVVHWARTGKEFPIVVLFVFKCACVALPILACLLGNIIYSIILLHNIVTIKELPCWASLTRRHTSSRPAHPA